MRGWHQNRISESRRCRVAGGGGDDGARRARGDLERDRRDVAAGGGQRQRREVAAEQGQDGLGLGVAEADVVLDEARPIGGQHQAGVEDADVRDAGGGEVIEDRLDERGHQLVGRVRDRCRRVGAHSPGVGAGVALADALVVLGQRERDRHASVAQGQQRALGAGHPLLEHERLADVTGRADGRFGLGVVGRHRDALAAGQPVELDDDRAAELTPPPPRAVDVAGAEASERRTGDPERRRQFAGIALRRLQRGELRRRPEARHAGRHAAIGCPGDERRLGAGDHEVGRRQVDGVEIRRDDDVVAVAPAGPGDRLLPAAAAEHDHAHQARTPSKLSLACASPTSSG